MEWQSTDDLRAGSCLNWPQGQIDFRYVDPYMLWADASGFRGTTRIGVPNGQCPVVVPAIIWGRATPSPPQAAGMPPPPLVAIGPAYRPTQGSWPQYFTATVSPPVFVKLRRGTKVSVPMPLGVPPYVQVGEVTLTVDWRATLGLTRVAASDVTPRLAPNISGNLAGAAPNVPVLAIIDDCCPFAHGAVRVRGVSPESRVMFLWDQGTDAGKSDPWWKQPADFSYGRELTSAEMRKLMQRSDLSPGGAVDEDACYAVLSHDAEGAAFRHGAAVMGLAAGAPHPLEDPGEPASPLDAAACAPIIFVQLPRQTLRDTSGGSLAVHVLDALRYIDARTTERDSQNQPVARTPLVVNISLGASAGPHDGTSLIEEAIDEFIASRDNCMVVVAAGNARDSHARAKIRVGAGRSRALALQVPPDQARATFMEAWFPDSQDAAQPHRFSLRLTPPGADATSSPWVAPGQAMFGVEMNSFVVNTAIAGVVNGVAVPNGDNGTMALVAVGPTASDGEADRPLCEPGLWRVDLRNEGAHEVEVNCWIERDDDRQAQFFDPDMTVTSHDTTLGSLAHGHRSLVIGGFRLSDRELLAASGEGPGRDGIGRVGPDAIGVADESEVLPGVLTCGAHSGEVVRLNGTSAAAALATRRLYNQLAAEVSPPKPWHEIKALFCTQLDEPLDPRHEPVTRAGAGRFLP